jgi:hypothetical protein
MANLQQKQQRNTPAFILGNGVSRKDLDLNLLRRFGAIYGCNALYREFVPDHLIAVDAKMIKEIVISGYHNRNTVWTNPNHSVKDITNINYLNPHLGWSSGPTAMWLAAQHGYTEIYIFGFDFLGINGKLNNVYANTANYRKSTDQATYYGNWINQTASVIKQNAHIKFYRVVGNSCHRDFKELPHGVQNFQHINYDEFLTKYT